MPTLTKFALCIVRPFVRPLIGLGVTGGLAVVALGQFGVSFDDLRQGTAVPKLVRAVAGGGCQPGPCGKGPEAQATLAGMFDSADLSDPGAIERLLRTGGALHRGGPVGHPSGEGDAASGSGEPARERGVVIFTPDGPAPASSALPAAEGDRVAPIVRPHRPDAD